MGKMGKMRMKNKVEGNLYCTDSQIDEVNWWK